MGTECPKCHGFHFQYRACGETLFTQVQLDEAIKAERELFKAHTKAVGAFLSEMAEIHSLDALDPPPVTVAEVTYALLQVSREIREKMAAIRNQGE